MSETLRQTIYQALAEIRLIDPHTHINPHAPASTTLADVLGYHYYTELAHSAGMPRELIEEPGLGPKERVKRIVEGIEPLSNTAQYSWLIQICRRFFDFEDDRLDTSNWERLYDASEEKMRIAEWPTQVLQQSNVEAVFLTNDFDDPLEDFDSRVYIPCLRTDELVFHLAKSEVRQRLAACSGTDPTDLTSLREALEQRFRHFVSRGARACAISLPPTFAPQPVSDGRAATALQAVLSQGLQAEPAHRDALARRVFWTLAELCDQYGLPFDLMIGVNRGVYPGGVYQGQDLYDSRVSLIQYRELFNAFPGVNFPISVLASVTNQELVSYAWIFPNVMTNGHWWYSNTPTFIERDAAARLEAVPQNKQIGYYSDAYKLEFVWPKFDMYRQILAKVLSESFVIDRGWSEERAIELGRRVLRGNVETIFPEVALADTPMAEEISDDGEAEPIAVGALGGDGLNADESLPENGSEASVETATFEESLDVTEPPAASVDQTGEVDEELDQDLWGDTDESSDRDATAIGESAEATTPSSLETEPDSPERVEDDDFQLDELEIDDDSERNRS